LFSIPLLLVLNYIIISIIPSKPHGIEAWGLSQTGIVVLGEFLAVVGEAILLYFIIFREDQRAILKAGLSSLIMNLLSLGAGWFLLAGIFR
jgi:hypothetical protein